jgi:hypothetical protein
MKKITGYTIILIMLISCSSENTNDRSNSTQLPIQGTWKLLTGTLIEKGDTIVTDYTKNASFIKIINDTHFAFLHHDLNKGKDSTPVYSSGGGSYTLSDSSYTEKLEYCTAREWEGHDFSFTVRISNDTLVQAGVEKVETAGIDRLNIEKYVRVKK